MSRTANGGATLIIESVKLRRFRVSLPSKSGALDEQTMQSVVEASPYWQYIQSQVVA
jgi:hypothetical protein